MNENTQLLTVAEFAAALRIKPSCVRRWAREAKVTVVHVGRLVRIPRTEVNRIIRLGTRPAKGVKSDELPGEIRMRDCTQENANGQTEDGNG